MLALAWLIFLTASLHATHWQPVKRHATDELLAVHMPSRVGMYSSEHEVSRPDVMVIAATAVSGEQGNLDSPEMESRESSRTSAKFTISGVWEPRERSDSETQFTATLTAEEYHQDGTPIHIDYGTEPLYNGEFLIEASVDEPKVAKLEITEGTSVVWRTHVVIEPNARITVKRRSRIDGMFVATSEEGSHARLLDSWRFEDEFVAALKETYVAAWDKSNRTGGAVTDEFHKLWQRSEGMKAENLKRLAWGSQDPLDSLLALELARKILAPGTLSTNAVIALYDKLATLLDQDVVARRVTPERERLDAFLRKIASSKRLTLGQQVPEFSLPDLQGETISLTQIVAEKDLILIDFWAVWCGPCIEAFPELKKLYEEYADEGFELVSISVDTTFEDWKQISKEHELPWIDLGAAGDLLSPTAVSFGIHGLPLTYLIDTNRRIVRNNIKPDELSKFLEAHYDKSSIQN